MNTADLVDKFYKDVAFDSTIAPDIVYFLSLGLPKTVISELAYMKGYCITNDATIESFLDRYLKEIKNVDIAALDRIISYIDILDRAKSNLIRILVRIHRNCSRGGSLPDLPKLPTVVSNSGAFVDLASGSDLLNYFQFFQKNIMYYGVDNSYFVCECLLQEAEEMAISNFSMLNMQIESLSRSDLPNEIVGIRAKNVRTYLVDYLSIMPVHYSWLADGGKLFIQEYAWKHTPKDILTVFEPTLELLHGSELSLIPGDPTNKFDVHTLEVTKNF